MIRSFTNRYGYAEKICEKAAERSEYCIGQRREAAMEDYFWNTKESETSRKLFVLVIYDIVSNKRRTKFAKEMNGYGFRVQKSAFEALIDEALFVKLQREIPKLIKEDEDSVRLYRMTGYGEIKLFGVNDKIEAEEVMII